MLLRLGIDLGTTFSCAAWLDERGYPSLVPWDGEETTLPSVVWFDGHEAHFGAASYAQEGRRPGGFTSYIKRDMGRPAEIPPHLYDDPDRPTTAPYAFGGFAFGVVGMQALLLRAIKRRAVRHAVERGDLPADADETTVWPEAVITVPAYFKDRERVQTKQAGEVAGLNVVGVINEPTAAALAYRLLRRESQRVFVFDLGGGTFDVTVLEPSTRTAEAGLSPNSDGVCRVLASAGHSNLGGKNWDDLIARYLQQKAFDEQGLRMPEGFEMCLTRLAVSAKIALSTHTEVRVQVPVPGTDPVVVPLSRRQAQQGPISLTDKTFYFESRSNNLLSNVRSTCEQCRRSVRVPAPGDGDRPMTWDDIDDVVMVGGSSRMPMIAAELERITGKPVRRQPIGFDFDTAVALGAAHHLADQSLVQDVSSATVGVKLRRTEDGITFDYVQPLVRKNTILPTRVGRTYQAGANAELFLYEGESDNPEECVLRGRLELNNPEGPVEVTLDIDRNGLLTATAVHDERGALVRRTLRIQNDLFDARLDELTRRIRSVVMHDEGPTRPSESDPCGGAGAVTGFPNT